MSYKLIENENDIYLELPKEKIKFASKEAETIYDLSLENDFLTRENEELKLQLKGTTHCYDKEEHKRLQEENKELKKQLKIKHDGFMASIEEKCELAEENQKLKEMQCTFLGTGCQNKMKEYKIQQREFIEYLEEPIKIITDGNPTNISEYTAGKLDALKEILSKYKEIIGEKDE